MSEKTLWELLWNYDPNGLLVVDADWTIQIVNPAFCSLFKIDEDGIVGQPVSTLIDDLTDLKRAREENIVIRKEMHYPKYDLYVRKVIFPMLKENIVACILVDLTSEYKRREEIAKIKQEMLENVDQVIDRQIKVVQEITGKLGETTADTKVSLIKIRNLLNEEIL
jgi:transcriptional regulator of aromatic amino acid metabolism